MPLWCLFYALDLGILGFNSGVALYDILATRLPKVGRTLVIPGQHVVHMGCKLVAVHARVEDIRNNLDFLIDYLYIQN